MEVDPLEVIPKPLLRWIESQRQLPSSITRARTFYEAAKAARTLVWARPLDHFAALHTWTTVALIVDDRTRKYMAELIPDEPAGLRWTIDAGIAVRVAMDELNKPSASSPSRQFKQRRDAVLRGLQAVRVNLAALDTDLPLRDLLIGPDTRKFRRAIERFTHADFSRRRNLGQRAREQAKASGASDSEVMVASFRALLKVHGNRVPDLSELLLAAEKSVCSMGEPDADRHGARSKYLRAMFVAMKHSAVESRRVAFLTYASEAIFGERIEKRDFRKLVVDLTDGAREKANAECMQAVAELQARVDAGIAEIGDQM